MSKIVKKKKTKQKYRRKKTKRKKTKRKKTRRRKTRIKRKTRRKNSKKNPKKRKKDDAGILEKFDKWTTNYKKFHDDIDKNKIKKGDVVMIREEDTEGEGVRYKFGGFDSDPDELEDGIYIFNMIGPKGHDHMVTCQPGNGMFHMDDNVHVEFKHLGRDILQQPG